jgi:hypothetical protein
MCHPVIAGTAISVSPTTTGRIIPPHDPLPTIKIHAITKGKQEWIIKIMKARPARSRSQWNYVESGFSCRFHGNTTGVYPFVNRDGERLAWVEFPGGDANLRAAIDVALKNMVKELD